MSLRDAAEAVCAARSGPADALEAAFAALQVELAAFSRWTPPPEPLTVNLPSPILDGSTTWTQISLHAPTLGELMKASATPGSSDQDVTRRLIAEVAGMSPDAVGRLPTWFITKINQYFDAFTDGPPLFPTDAV